VTLWTLPAALIVLSGLLALASHLEARRVRVLVRLSVRNRGFSPDLAEALVAAELAPVLAAHGFQRS
jgi:hypothetical protein